MRLTPNPLFVGRTDELQQLARLVMGGATAAIVATTGMGGIGKTQLAVEFAHRYGRFFAGGVFWLSFADAAGVQAEVLACADPVRHAPLSLEDRGPAVQAEWQSPLPRLLIFDNCEEEALLRRWQPSSGGSRVLLTSRRPEWPADLGVRPLSLGQLSPHDAVALLRMHLKGPADDNLNQGDDDPDLAAIADELGYLALALHLAGSVLARYGPTLPPAAYLVQLRRPNVLEGRWLAGTEGSPTGHDGSLRRTVALSYDRLDPADATDALALALLARAALLAPGEPIPRPLLLATIAPEIPGLEALPDADGGLEASLQAEDALRRLIELGLLEDEAAGALRLHRLLAAFTRAVQADAGGQPAVERALLAAAWEVEAAGVAEGLLALQPHLRAVTDAAMVRDDGDAADLCDTLGGHLQAVAAYDQARPYLERALAIRERALGPGHPDTAASLNNLASLLQAQGDYAAARPLYERAVAVHERALGPDHSYTATGLNNLASLLQAQGDYAAARPLYERALAIREEVLGPGHPDTAAGLNNLASLLQALGHNAAARPLLERAVAIRERALGPDHPDTAVGLGNLALLLQAQGDYAAARPLYERALAIREEVLGPDHPDTAIGLSNLASLLQEQGDYAAARPLYERALEIQGRALGHDHPDTITVRENLQALLDVESRGEQGA